MLVSLLLHSEPVIIQDFGFLMAERPVRVKKAIFMTFLSCTQMHELSNTLKESIIVHMHELKHVFLNPSEGFNTLLSLSSLVFGCDALLLV